MDDFMKLFLALDPGTRRECGDESYDEESREDFDEDEEDDWMVLDVYPQDW